MEIEKQPLLRVQAELEFTLICKSLPRPTGPLSQLHKNRFAAEMRFMIVPNSCSQIVKTQPSLAWQEIKRMGEHKLDCQRKYIVTDRKPITNLNSDSDLCRRNAGIMLLR